VGTDTKENRYQSRKHLTKVDEEISHSSSCVVLLYFRLTKYHENK
jgi:hypothetical protein